jgi:hypothetical protein
MEASVLIKMVVENQVYLLRGFFGFIVRTHIRTSGGCDLNFREKRLDTSQNPLFIAVFSQFSSLWQAFDHNR